MQTSGFSEPLRVNDRLGGGSHVRQESRETAPVWFQAVRELQLSQMCCPISMGCQLLGVALAEQLWQPTEVFCHAPFFVCLSI